MEVVERSERNNVPLSLQSCNSSIFAKKIPNRNSNWIKTLFGVPNNQISVRLIHFWLIRITPFFFYKNSFYKNHQAQNCQKIKNILRIMARLKYMIKNLESHILILHQEVALFTMECLLFTKGRSSISCLVFYA